MLLLVDEAHNFGAYKISNCLKVDYPYRLALSATLERNGDLEGTQKLYNFFGKKCIEYPLERAIQENKLTRYKYYPVLVSLTGDELEEYIELTKQISKAYARNPDSDFAKGLLLKRARLIAGAHQKIEKLKSVISAYKHDHNMLIYCGAVKYGEDGYDDDTDGKKQIKRVI